MELLLPDGVPRESMMKDLGAIREELSSPPARDICAGAIERVAAITLEELEATPPGALDRVVQS
jgi:hypothetical protein